MNHKTFLPTIVFVLTLTLGGVKAAKRAGASDESPVGPYTEIRLPLEDLPEPNQDLVYNPVIDQNPSGATLQIMHVLKDPRDVPEARFAYYSPENGGVVSHTLLPSDTYDAWAGGETSYAEELKKIRKENPIALNVYVRVQAPEDQEVPDPIFAGYYQDEDIKGFFSHFHTSGGRPNLFIYRMSKVKARDQHLNSYLCAVPEYADGTQSYRLPDEIAGGKAVRGDGRYDPKAYAPPRPWYYGKNPKLEPGEVREGWISCMAPDVPLEELQIRVRYTYIEPPEPTPTPGPSPTPWPTPSDEDEIITRENCEERDDCAIVDDLNDPVCAEVSVCILRLDPTNKAPIATPDATEIVLQKTNEAERYLPRESTGEKIAWSYSSARSFPDGGIKLDDVSLRFINHKGEEKTARGSVVFQSAHTIRLDGKRYFSNEKFVFVSKVTAEPQGLSEKELRGFALSGVGVYVEIYDRPDAPFVNASHNPGMSLFHKHNDGVFIPTLSSSTSAYKLAPQDSRMDFVPANYWLDEFDLSEGPKPFSDLFLYKPDSPLEGYVFAGLGNDDERHLGYQTYRDLNKDLPPTVWFSIMPRLPVYQSYKTLYPSRGVNIRNNTLDTSTNMCEIVDCLEVRDPDDELREVRTVPVFCPGEWANNFTINGMRTERVEYFGEPPGLKRFPTTWANYSLYQEKPEFWFYDGKIMGGLTPWWFDYHSLWGYSLATHKGTIVDPNTGEYVDIDISFLPFYHKSARQYYVPLEESLTIGGWMSGIISEKLLITGKNNQGYSTDNPVFLFQEEGPAWSTGCSRSPLPTLTSADRYAPNHATDNIGFESAPHIMTELMPGMTYPVSQPRITGKVLSLGEEGGTIFGQVLKPVDVQIIPGKKNKPVVYVPDEEKFYPAVKNVSMNNELFFQNAGAVLIPPSSSLVMVKIVKTPPGGPIKCEEIDNRNLQLIYPNHYPITSQPGSLRIPGRFLSFCPEDFSEEWVIFRFPSRNIDREKLTFSIRGEENWVFWNLGEK